MSTVIEIKGDRQELKEEAETTDMALFVRTSDEAMLDWDRQRIVDALVRETYVDFDTAGEIAREVEDLIATSKIRMITAPLIRELVDAKLIERGLEQARKMHTRLGMPLFDVDQLILHPNKENANVPHGPEATNLTLAERIKKEYALLSVFSQEVADAHMRGDIHLHDLGFVDRPYCSGQSLEYIKRFGLSLPNSIAMAKPARHPEVLLAHIVTIRLPRRLPTGPNRRDILEMLRHLPVEVQIGKDGLSASGHCLLGEFKDHHLGHLFKVAIRHPYKVGCEKEIDRIPTDGPGKMALEGCGELHHVGQQNLGMFGGLRHGDGIREAQPEALNVFKGLSAAVRPIDKTEVMEMDIPPHMGIGDLLRKDGEEGIFLLDPFG